MVIGGKAARGGAMSSLDGDAPATADASHSVTVPLPDATSLDRAEIDSHRCRPRRLPIPAHTAALPLPPDVLWRATLADLVRRQPREAQYLAAAAGMGCDGEQFFVRAPSVWVADRMEGRLRREIEALLRALAGRDLTLACVVPPGDEPAAVRLAM